jgi:hypothetical protein
MLILASMTFTLWGTAKAGLKPIQARVLVECFHDDAKADVSIHTISQSVDYVQVENGITSGYIQNKISWDVKPDTQVFTSPDRCLIQSVK